MLGLAQLKMSVEGAPMSAARSLNKSRGSERDQQVEAVLEKL